MNIQCFNIRKMLYGKEVDLYPTLLSINGKNYLIDCGYEETYGGFVEALEKLQVTVKDLYAIIISHDDIDHLGALAYFKNENPDLQVYCSHIEEPSVTGKIKSERLEQAERSLSSLPEEYKPRALQFIEQLKSIKRVPVNQRLYDREKIEEAVEVIFTPGHTKGHLSFFIPGEKTVIASDALVMEDGVFEIANPMFTLDMQQAIRSVERIRELKPERIICYHGGITNEDIDTKLAMLIRKYSKQLLK